MKGYFVTGTGTGVGKTFVGCALARRGVLRGRRVFAFKPIETGCARVGGELVGADQSLLVAAAGDWQRDHLRGLYQFEPPVAPSVAARHAGVTIDLRRIVEVVAEGAAQTDLVIVEGAGGWRVPITRTEDMATLALACGLPVIVVAPAGLGTINHSLLTLEVVEKTCQVAALVLSIQPNDDSTLAHSNRDEIQERWRGRVLLSGQVGDL